MVFPPVERLNVQALPAPPVGPPALVLIDVPAQSEELKPFVVSAAIVQGHVKGAFISIVRRRGEDWSPCRPPPFTQPSPQAELCCVARRRDSGSHKSRRVRRRR